MAVRLPLRLHRQEPVTPLPNGAGANGSLTAEVGEPMWKAWKVNNEVVAGETGLTYTIASLEDAVEVTVEFEKISYTLTYTAGENGRKCH
jgi:hypothetical protein